MEKYAQPIFRKNTILEMRTWKKTHMENQKNTYIEKWANGKIEKYDLGKYAQGKKQHMKKCAHG